MEAEFNYHKIIDEQETVAYFFQLLKDRQLLNSIEDAKTLLETSFQQKESQYAKPIRQLAYEIYVAIHSNPSPSLSVLESSVAVQDILSQLAAPVSDKAIDDDHVKNFANLVHETKDVFIRLRNR